MGLQARIKLARAERQRQRMLEGRRFPSLEVLPASATPSIYYLSPHSDRPTGGIRVIYRHVDLLNSLGLAAAVLHSDGYERMTWFEHETRIETPRSIRLESNDLLVVPEYYGAGLDSLPRDVGKVIFNQGSHHTFDRLDFEATAPGAPYRDLPGLRGVLTVSEDSRRLLSLAFPELSISVVRNVVDERIFYPGKQERKRRIAFMPTRRFEECEQLRHVLRSRGLGWELMPIGGLSEMEVARLLRESAIFLSLSDRDGFGLPAAEAMACGCYVVGYTGGGGDEFFDSSFSAPVPGFVELLEKLIWATEQPPEVLADLGLRASAAILSRYTEDGLKGDLMEFYGQHLGK